MKTKLMLPLAALLMLPTMSSCGSDKYEASFNNDQYICAHGTQIVDVTLDSYVKNKLSVKKDLQKDDFEIPEKYKAKEIKYVEPYSDDSFFLVISGDINDLEDSTSFDITVKKSAFTKDNLGGKITVCLLRNEIKYDGFSSESIGPDSYEGTSKVEVIGARFNSAIVNKTLTLDADGKPKEAGLTNILQVNNVNKEGGEFGYYETDKGSYIYLNVEFNTDAKVSVTFNASATDLDRSCVYTPHGLGGGDHNYFN